MECWKILSEKVLSERVSHPIFAMYLCSGRGTIPASRLVAAVHYLRCTTKFRFKTVSYHIAMSYGDSTGQCTGVHRKKNGYESICELKNEFVNL